MDEAGDLKYGKNGHLVQSYLLYSNTESCVAAVSGIWESEVRNKARRVLLPYDTASSFGRELVDDEVEVANFCSDGHYVWRYLCRRESLVAWCQEAIRLSSHLVCESTGKRRYRVLRECSPTAWSSLSISRSSICRYLRSLSTCCSIR